MSVQRLLTEQRKNSQMCIQILSRCKTRQKTIEAFGEIARILKAAGDPVAEAAEEAYRVSDSLSEEAVLQLRDQFIRQFQAFLASTETGVKELGKIGKKWWQFWK